MSKTMNSANATGNEKKKGSKFKLFAAFSAGVAAGVGTTLAIQKYKKNGQLMDELMETGAGGGFEEDIDIEDEIFEEPPVEPVPEEFESVDVENDTILTPDPVIEPEDVFHFSSAKERIRDLVGDNFSIVNRKIVDVPDLERTLKKIIFLRSKNNKDVKLSKDIHGFIHIVSERFTPFVLELQTKSWKPSETQGQGEFIKKFSYTDDEIDYGPKNPVYDAVVCRDDETIKKLIQFTKSYCGWTFLLDPEKIVDYIRENPFTEEEEEEFRRLEEPEKTDAESISVPKLNTDGLLIGGTLDEAGKEISSEENQDTKVASETDTDITPADEESESDSSEEVYKHSPSNESAATTEELTKEQEFLVRLTDTINAVEDAVSKNQLPRAKRIYNKKLLPMKAEITNLDPKIEALVPVIDNLGKKVTELVIAEKEAKRKARQKETGIPVDEFLKKEKREV